MNFNASDEEKIVNPEENQELNKQEEINNQNFEEKEFSQDKLNESNVSAKEMPENHNITSKLIKEEKTESDTVKKSKKKRIDKQENKKCKEKINDEKERGKQFLFNFNISTKPDTKTQPMIFLKYYNKRCESEYEFRKLASSYEVYCNEITYLYQEDKDKENINDQLIQFQNTLNNTIEKLLHAAQHQERINVITDFYIHNNIQQFQEQIITQLYHPIHKIPEEIQGIDRKVYFQEFEPLINKTEIKFDKINLIKPPKNYDCKLDSESVDKYDKFISIVNMIITLQKFIEFNTKFDQQNKLYSKEEKKLYEDERRKDEEKRIEQERQELIEEKKRIQKEEEILLEDERKRKEMKLHNFDQQIQEKKQILTQLNESISTLQTQISLFEKRRDDLEKHFFAVEKERIQVEKELSDNYNELLKCLKETHKKEKNIETLIHECDKKQHQNPMKKLNSERSLESFTFIEMNKDEKETYFNELINRKDDTKYKIQSKDFCTLIEDIHIVNEQQFDYMINFYNFKHSIGDKYCKFIFKNLEIIPIPMLQKIYELKDFSVQYLSEKVLAKLVHRSLLCEKLVVNMEKILFIKNKNEEEQEKLINKCKKDYYSICNSTSNEVFIFDDTKVIESLFFNGYSIEKVVIPESVVEIQDNAFYDCKNLKTVVMNCNKLKVIGKSAFSGCINLESFTIPDKIKVIHKSTFQGCQNLTKINLPSGLEEMKGKVFSGCKSLTKIKIPKNIHKIGKACFENCTSLKFILIPGVLAIYPKDEEAPKGIKDETTVDKFKISAKCFSKCKEIQNVIITNKCHLIDQFAFSICPKLEEVRYSLTNGSNIEINAFSECPTLKRFVFNVNNHSSLELSDSVFLNCKELKEILFNQEELLAKDSLIIDSNVFKGCEKLQRFVFPANCKKEIGESCFEGCKSLESVTLPSGMTYISKSMFKGCQSLTTINLDQTITMIEANAFENCQKLQIENLPENLVKIGDNAFKKCISLVIKEMPSKLEEICKSSFENCIHLTEITFPSSMKIIQEKAFEYCLELDKVIIHSKTIKIFKKSFYKCPNLKKIFLVSKDGISPDAFKECSGNLEFLNLESL